MLLLSNLNILDFDVWTFIAKFWPVIIIAMGLDLLLGRSVNIGHFIIIGLIILFAFGNRGNRFFLSDQDVITKHISVDMPDSKSADIEVNFGVGQVTLSTLDDDAILLSGELDILEGSEISEDIRSGEIFFYQLGYEDNYQGVPFQIDNDYRWDIEINDDIPVSLKLDTGVGQVKMYLREMDLLDLDLNMGVGEVIIELPETGDYDVDIDGGIGELVVYIPDGVGVRIIVDTGIGTFNVPDGYEYEGNVYTNDLYATSENRVNMRINSGIGSVAILEMP
jgi:hypothetical protein